MGGQQAASQGQPTTRAVLILYPEMQGEKNIQQPDVITCMPCLGVAAKTMLIARISRSGGVSKN